MKSFGSIGILIFFLTAALFGVDIYVSPSGNDNAAGTVDAPLKTIAKARDKADEVKTSGPVTVYLMGGTFYLSSPVVFGQSNSGTATAPVVYKNYPGQKPVISGGINITGATWVTSSGSIMKTTIEKNLKVDQLFLNGKRQVLARYPNYNENAILQGSASDALSKAGAADNPAEGPGYVRALHGSMWGGNSYIITGKSGSSVTTSWVGDNNRGSGMHSSYRMVENIYELLDAAGEWFYRKSTGELFFWPPSGTNLSTATIELASLTELVRFVGSSPSASVKYITFDGITFTHTYRSLFDGTGDFYEKVTKSDWGIVRKGTVFMQNAEFITIRNCMFDQIGGNGVFLSGHNRNNVVYNCDFQDAGASCVCLFGLRSSIRCPNTWSGTVSCSDRTPGPAANGEYPSYIKIENNMMNRLGRFEKQTAGVTISASEFDTIRHNTIHNIPRAGINFCDGCWGGHVIEYNWVYDCVKESGDHGPFNAWGRDRNEIFGQNDVAASKLDARNPTIVRKNRFEVNPGNFGIDLDDQATNYYQEYNLLIGGGFKLQWNRYNTYLNCILAGGADVQFHGVWGSSSHYGARNIIFNNRDACVYQFCCGSNPSQVKGAIAQWDSNVVYSTRGEPKCSDWNNCNSGNYSWSQWTGAGLDTRSRVADPMFTDTQKVWRSAYLPKGDWNPRSGSPALALGFKPFVMDSFGVMGTPGPSVTTMNEPKRFKSKADETSYSVYCKAGNLVVSCDGVYRLRVITAAGKVVSEFNGKDRSIFALDDRRVVSGIYLAAIHSDNGILSRRFIFEK